MMTRILIGLMLSVCSVQDLRCRRIHAGLMCAFGAAAVLVRLAADPSLETCAAIGLGALPGTGLWLLSLVTHEAVGRGDALIVLLTGMGTGLSEIMSVLLLALFGIAGAGCLMLLMRHADRKSRLPFVPFLCAAYLLMTAFF